MPQNAHCSLQRCEACCIASSHNHFRSPGTWYQACLGPPITGSRRSEDPAIKKHRWHVSFVFYHFRFIRTGGNTISSGGNPLLTVGSCPGAARACEGQGLQFSHVKRRYTPGNINMSARTAALPGGARPGCNGRARERDLETCPFNQRIRISISFRQGWTPWAPHIEREGEKRLCFRSESHIQRRRWRSETMRIEIHHAERSTRGLGTHLSGCALCHAAPPVLSFLCRGFGRLVDNCIAFSGTDS